MKEHVSLFDRNAVSFSLKTKICSLFRICYNLNNFVLFTNLFLHRLVYLCLVYDIKPLKLKYHTSNILILTILDTNRSISFFLLTKKRRLGFVIRYTQVIYFSKVFYDSPCDIFIYWLVLLCWLKTIVIYGLEYFLCFVFVTRITSYVLKRG